MTASVSKINKPKILIVGAFPKPEKKVYGGQVTVCRELMKSSFTEKFHLDLLDSSQNGNPVPSMFNRGISATIRLCIFYYKIIFRKPDCLILFFSHGTSALEKGLMAKLGKMFRIPVVLLPRAEELIFQCERSKVFSTILRGCLSQADAVICQGRKFVEFCDSTLDIPKQKSFVINNWTVNSDVMDIGKARDYSSRSSKKNILFLAWLEEHKGVRELLNAVKLLHDEDFEFHLWVAGGGNLSKTAADFLKNNDLDSKVTLCGWVHGDEKLKLFEKCDIFVLPSYGEGFSNSLLEAMASGLASVITDAGTARDYLENNFHAIFCEKKNVESLYISLKQLLADPQLVSLLGWNSYCLVNKDFSSQELIEYFGECVENTITEHGCSKI